MALKAKTKSLSTKSTVDRKRSLAAKKAAATRAKNRELAASQQLGLHHKLIAGGAIFVTLLFAVVGIYNVLSAYAASTTGVAVVGYGGKCLDNYYSRLRDGNPVQLYKCNGTNAQKWIVGTDGSLRNVSGNYCVDITNGNMSAGAYIQLYRCNGTNAQKFVAASGYIKNPTSSLALTSKTVTSSTGGTRIWMQTAGTPIAAIQKWSGTQTAGGGTSGGTSGGGTTAPTAPASPTPTTPAPTPTPTPTPTPAPSTGSTTSGTSTNSQAGNIAVLPDFYDSTWLSWNDGYNKFPVTWQGYTNTLQIAANPSFISGQRASGWTGENEVNGMVCSNGLPTGCSRSQRGNRVAVRPGQKVTYSAYVWVTPSTVGAPNGGGFQFFMDIYGSGGRIKELQGTNGCDGCGRVNVPYGSTGWKFVQMQVTIPSSYNADGALGYSGGSSVTPTGIIPILQLNNWAVPAGYNDKATAYIRNTVLTVQ